MRKKISGWAVWNQRLKTGIKWKTVKNYWAFTPSKKKIFCVHAQNGSNKDSKKCEVEIIDNRIYFWVKRKAWQVESDATNWAQRINTWISTM